MGEKLRTSFVDGPLKQTSDLMKILCVRIIFAKLYPFRLFHYRMRIYISVAWHHDISRLFTNIPKTEKVQVNNRKKQTRITVQFSVQSSLIVQLTHYREIQVPRVFHVLLNEWTTSLNCVAVLATGSSSAQLVLPQI